MSNVNEHEAPMNVNEEEMGGGDAGSLVSGGKVSGKGKGGKGKGKAGAGAKGGKKGGAKGKGKGKASTAGKGKGKSSGKAGGGGGKGGKAGDSTPRITRSFLSELTFPVGRIHSRMKASILRKQRVAGTAAVYLTALLEYLAAELLDLSSTVCESKGNKRITPRHILLAIRGDPELNQLVTAQIARGGVVETGVAKQLLQKGSKAAKEAAGSAAAAKKGKKAAGKKKSGTVKKGKKADGKKGKKSGASKKGGNKKGGNKKGGNKKSSPTASPKKKSAA